MDISGYLQEQQAAGRSDSEGTFTIGLRESLRKLREYQFQQPEIYVLLLVSAAIAQGARRVEVRENSQRLTLSFPGCVYTPEQLEEFQRALGSDLQAQAHRLTLGLLGALNCVEGGVFLTSSSGIGAFRWRVESGGGKITRSRVHEQPGTIVEIHRHSVLKGLFKRFSGFAGLSPEARLLYDRCERSLTPVEIQGKQVTRPIVLGEVPILTTVGEVQVEAQPILRMGWAGIGWSGVISLSSRPLLVRDSNLQAIVHGVSLTLPKVEMVQGIVWHDGLKSDLSQSGILEDETCAQLLEQLRQMRDEMIAVIRRNIPFFGLEKVLQLQQLLGPEPIHSTGAMRQLYESIAARRLALTPSPPSPGQSPESVPWDGRGHLLKALESLESSQLGIALLEFNKLERASNNSSPAKAAAILGDAICRQLLTGESHLSRGFARVSSLRWTEIPRLGQAAEQGGVAGLRSAFCIACHRLLSPAH